MPQNISVICSVRLCLAPVSYPSNQFDVRVLSLTAAHARSQPYVFLT